MKRSLHIGINDYPGTSMDLNGCVNDAVAWRHALASRGFDDQTEMLDSAATKRAMLALIGDIVSKTGRNDISVITYSGHGSWVPDADGDEADGRDEALCPYDMTMIGEVLTDDELHEIFSNRKQGARIIFISDSCHSGSVTRMSSKADDPFAGEKWSFQQAKFMPPGIYLTLDQLLLAQRVERSTARSKIRAATVLLSGCMDNEYSYDAWFNGKANGAMTYIALWCLNKMTPENTYWDWYQAIRRYLPHNYYPQTPQLDCSYKQRRWKLFQE